MSKPDYIVSDIHLGAVPAATEAAFRRFLENAGAEAKTLVINGDLFDFWFEWGPVIPARHYRSLAALAEVVEAGVPVTLVGGNHDAWGGRFLRDEIGIRLHNGLLRLDLGGRKSLVAHGDGLGKGDYTYRALKKVIQSRLATWGFRILHPEIGIKIASRASSTHEATEANVSSRNRAMFLREWGQEELAADPELRFVTCGHSHVPELVEVEPGRHYVNSGDWVLHRTYVTIAEGEAPEIKTWV